MPERRSHAAAAGAALALLLLPLLPVAIDGASSLLRSWRRGKKRGRGRGRGGSALYEGRVWHTRLRPARHSFTYPIFFAFVDVDEPELFPWYWWPLASGSRLLPAIVKFDERDHLKDRGLGNSPSLSEALRQRIKEATGWQPDGPIKLLTHLSYFGYCFNPVSFYYCYGADESEGVKCIVGEVSNTPWLEMHCYFLSASTEGVNQLAAPRGELRYRFPKCFHVSPFMSMNHTYDWTFSEPGEKLRVVTSMEKNGSQGGETYFSARVSLSRLELTAVNLLRLLLLMPSYTALVQIWIHVEAFRVWMKGVTYFPHPEGVETLASRVIGAGMAPLFSLQKKLQSLRK